MNEISCKKRRLNKDPSQTILSSAGPSTSCSAAVSQNEATNNTQSEERHNMDVSSSLVLNTSSSRQNSSFLIASGSGQNSSRPVAVASSRGQNWSRPIASGRGRNPPRPIAFGRGQNPSRPVAFGRGQNPSRPIAFGRGQNPSRPIAFGRGQNPSRPIAFGRGHNPARPIAFGRGQNPARPIAFGRGQNPARPIAFGRGQNAHPNRPRNPERSFGTMFEMCGKRVVNVGDSEYDELNGCIDFLDKSLLAWNFFEDSDHALFATAPSRFGKTSNLKMLQKFFGIQMIRSGITCISFTNVKREDGKLVEDYSNMSENFKIFLKKKIFEDCHCSTPVKDCSICKQWFYEHCGQHPIMFIELETIRSTCMSDVVESLNEVIRKAYKQHEYLITEINEKTVWSSTKKEEMGSHWVGEFLQYYSDREYEKFWFNTNTSQEQKQRYLVKGLPFLAECLSLHFKTEDTGKGVILLVDDFDVFVCEMLFNGGANLEITKHVKGITQFVQYWGRILLKECKFVEKALLVACSSMGAVLSFGANKSQLRLFLDTPSFSEAFGITEQELRNLIEIYLKMGHIDMSRKKLIHNIKGWYNGYSTIQTKKRIFSTCSVLCYLRSGQLQLFWKDKVGLNHLDSLLADDLFHETLFEVLPPVRPIASIEMTETIVPQDLCILNEMIHEPMPTFVYKESVNLCFQFWADCGFFNITQRAPKLLSIKVPNHEIHCRIRKKVLSGFLRKRTPEFDSSKVSAFLASLQSLQKTSSTLRDSNIPLCIKVAKSIANLYANKEIPNNYFEIQVDLYILIYRSGKFPNCAAEFRVDHTNAPRIDIFFITNGTAVVLEIKHFKNTKNVDTALEHILDKKYYKVCERRFSKNITGNRVLLGVLFADDRKISVGCLVNIDPMNSKPASDGSVKKKDEKPPDKQVVMKRRTCVDSDERVLFPLTRGNDGTCEDTLKELEQTAI